MRIARLAARSVIVLAVPLLAVIAGIDLSGCAVALAGQGVLRGISLADAV